MAITSTYPVLLSSDVSAAAEFYVEHFGFEKTFEADWYVSLRNGAFELAVLDDSHETIPPTLNPKRGGFLFNIEVDDATSLYEQLKGKGLNVVLELRDEDFGQRHFIMVGPDEVVIDVIEPIEPSADFATAFLA